MRKKNKKHSATVNYMHAPCHNPISFKKNIFFYIIDDNSSYFGRILKRSKMYVSNRLLINNSTKHQFDITSNHGLFTLNIQETLIECRQVRRVDGITSIVKNTKWYQTRKIRNDLEKVQIN